jgi:hypothetical protein
LRCCDATASSFVAKVRGEVFAHIQEVAAKRYSSMRHWLFGLLGRIVYEQSSWCQRKWWAFYWLCSSPVLLFRPRRVWTCRVRLMLSSPNAFLIIFSEICTKHDAYSLFVCWIHREIAFCTLTPKIFLYYHLPLHLATTIAVQMTTPVPEIIDASHIYTGTWPSRFWAPRIRDCKILP